MPLFEWSDKLSVNVREMDQQHKKLFDLINDFYDALFEDTEMEIIEKIFEGLLDYTEMHFGREEELMKQYSFSGYSVQKQQHENLVNEVVDMHKRYLSGDKEISVRIAILLRDWLQDHIVVEDKKYGAHFNSKGIT